MELLIAFLMAFGVVSAENIDNVKSSDEAKQLIAKSDLEKDYLIWEAEADDF